MSKIEDIFDKIFDKFDFDEKPNTNEVKKDTKVKEKKMHKEDIKEHTNDEVIKEKDKIINKLKEELEEFKEKNTVYIDLDNTDDRKILRQLVNEGKILLNKNKPFIVTDIPTFGVNNSMPPAHTIYCEDIIRIDYRQYYLDLSSMPKGKRTKAYSRIWVSHKGYSTYDLIDEKLFNYLLDNGFVPQINYSHVDLSNGMAFNTENETEPDEAFIKLETERLNKINDKMKSKKVDTNDEK